MLRHFDVIVHFGFSFLKFAGLSICFGESMCLSYCMGRSDGCGNGISVY